MSASQSSLTPSRVDFAALLNESYGESEAFEGTVVKGTVVGIEKDMAVIDIGLKTEGRVALKEFSGPGRDQAPAATTNPSSANTLRMRIPSEVTGVQPTWKRKARNLGKTTLL